MRLANFIAVMATLAGFAAAGYTADAINWNGQVFSAQGWEQREMSVARQQLWGAGKNLPAKADARLTGWQLIHLSAPITPQLKADLAAKGIQLSAYLPRNAFLAKFPAAGRTMQELGAVDFGFALVPPLKIAPEVYAATSLAGLPLVLELLPDAAIDQVLAHLQHLSIPVHGVKRDAARPRVAVEVKDDGQLKAVAGLDEVFCVQRGYGAKLLNSIQARITQGGSNTAERAINAKGLRGEGQVAAILDTGIDYSICWFADPSGATPPVNIGTSGSAEDLARRKIVACDFLDSPPENPNNPLQWDTYGHGTAVAGCIGGNQIAHQFDYTDSYYNGPAPACQIVMQDGGFATDPCGDIPAIGCPVIDLTPIFEQAYRQGARFHNNSWGDREDTHPNNDYSPACVDVDDFTWRHPDMLIVCAAGNDGPLGANSVCSPSVSKNALSVGATESLTRYNDVADFSSRGWANDGRLKPDLVAPGASVHIPANTGNVLVAGCDTREGMGTSFASPCAVGCGVLVRQYLREGWYPYGVRSATSELATPSAALVKAMLINSSVDLPAVAHIPGRDQGWGRIRLDQVLYFAGGQRKLYLHDDTPGFDQPFTRQWRVALQPNGASEALKITLVWSDYPATAGANPQLVNDLDLRLDLNGVTYHGDNFSGGYSVPGGNPDHINNVEQILIPAPSVGQSALVTVTPLNIPQGPQPFALVITGGFAVLTADLNHDGVVDSQDLWLFGQEWNH